MSGQSEDADGLTGFFFYMFIVHPITAWILRPGRFERKKSIMYAIGFLALLAAVKTGTFLCLSPCRMGLVLCSYVRDLTLLLGILIFLTWFQIQLYITIQPSPFQQQGYPCNRKDPIITHY